MITATIWDQSDFEKTYLDIIKLCSSWWKDTLFSKALGIEFKPTRDFYLNNSDRLIVVLLRDSDKNDKLVGCYVGILTNYMFNVDIVQLAEIVWCVERSYRGKSLANQLLDTVDTVAKERGVELMSMSSPTNTFSYFIERFLKKRGYLSADTLLYKRI